MFCLVEEMARNFLRIFFEIALLSVPISSVLSKNVQVYRYSRRDVFSHPEYSSHRECGTKTCTKYQAKCLDDGNCCFCRCNSKFSTYNVSQEGCVLDKAILSAGNYMMDILES